MENKVISTEYVKKNFIHKDKIIEIIKLINDNKELVYLSNGELMCTSDARPLLDYLEELLEETENE